MWNDVLSRIKSRQRLMDVLTMKRWVGFVINVCWVSGGGVHVSTKSDRYLLKTLKE